MAGKFLKTLTISTPDVPVQLSALMAAADSTTDLHIAEIVAFGDEANTDVIYMGDASMVSPGAGVAPVNYAWKFQGSSNPYVNGRGAMNNAVHTTDYWLMVTAAPQKIHVDTRVV